MTDGIEDRILTVVQTALDPYIERLAEPEPLAYSVPQAARMLQTSPNTIRRLIDQGRLRRIPHMGQRVLIPRRSLVAFVDGEL